MERGRTLCRLRTLSDRFCLFLDSGRNLHESRCPYGNGLRRRWKRIVSGYCQLFLGTREKKS